MPATWSIEAAGRRHRHGADARSAITLGANVENLTLTGAAAINGTGNSARQHASPATAAANTLDGGAGADTMTRRRSATTPMSSTTPATW